MLTYLAIVLGARFRSERGTSAVEYGLLVAGVAAACIVALETLGIGARAVFEHQNSIVAEP